MTDNIESTEVEETYTADETGVITAHTGFTVTEDWLGEFRKRRNDALTLVLLPIPGAVAAVLVGYHRFFGQRISLRLTYANVAFALAGITVFHYVFPSFVMRTAIVSTYPPRACGIGTFAAEDAKDKA
mgnify:CR=1 FL=1